MLSEGARQVERRLAAALGLEPGVVRQYVGELLEERLARGRPAGGRRTGFRMVRGSHGCTYLRDPDGVDMLPPGVVPPPESSTPPGRAASRQEGKLAGPPA